MAGSVLPVASLASVLVRAIAPNLRGWALRAGTARRGGWQKTHSGEDRARPTPKSVDTGYVAASQFICDPKRHLSTRRRVKPGQRTCARSRIRTRLPKWSSGVSRISWDFVIGFIGRIFREHLTLRLWAAKRSSLFMDAFGIDMRAVRERLRLRRDAYFGQKNLLEM
jgi:hypothetical protein